MTIKSKWTTLFAAGMLASAVAAHAQGAMAPDPNIAPSTSSEEAELPGTSAHSPELAVAPDPNLGPSTTDEEAAIQSGVLSARPSAASDTPEAVQ